MLFPSTSALLDTSLRASTVIVLLLCLRPALRRWIGSPALAWLWLAVAIRLLFPLPVSAPWRVPTLFPAAPAAILASSSAFHVSISTADTPTNTRVAQGTRLTSPPQSIGRLYSLSSLWLLGSLLAAARLAWGWWTVHRWAARTIPPADGSPAQSAYLDLPTELRRNITLHLTDALDSPTLVGVLRPQIWLPRALAGTLSPAELHHVLLHELGHARRHDLLAQWCCSLACCLHWFNPLVWLLARLARTDRELACDAWVLSQNSLGVNYAAYGHTLLKVVVGMRLENSRPLPTVSMAAGKRGLDRRIREIRAFCPVAPWRGVFAIVATLTAVVVFTFKGAVLAQEASSPTPTIVLPAPVSVAAPAPGSPFKTPATSAQVMIQTKLVTVADSTVEAFRKSAQAGPASKFAAQIVRIYDLQHSHDPAAPAGIVDAGTVYNSAEYDAFVCELNQQKGVDLLSAPSVTTKSGQKATIEIIREFVAPVSFEHGKDSAGKPTLEPKRFDKTNVGLTLEVEPMVPAARDLVDLNLNWKQVNFVGFVGDDGQPPDPQKPSNRQRPVFHSHSVSTVVTLTPGSTLLLSDREDKGGFRQGIDMDDHGLIKSAPPPANPGNLVFCLITATIVEPAGSLPASVEKQAEAAPPTPADTPASSPTAEVSADPYAAPASYPFAIPVPGRIDLFTSPYAPNAGYIDLRGFTRGQSVRDPYTDKMLLVP